MFPCAVLRNTLKDFPDKKTQGDQNRELMSDRPASNSGDASPSSGLSPQVGLRLRTSFIGGGLTTSSDRLEKYLRVAVLGDVGCGKSTLIQKWTVSVCVPGCGDCVRAWASSSIHGCACVRVRVCAGAGVMRLAHTQRTS